MIFLPLSNITKASSRVRVFWIIPFLPDARYLACDFLACLFWRILFNIKDEVFIFQKNTSKYHVLLVRFLNSLGKKTIFDIDDYPSFNDSEITLRNFQRMCKSTNLVLAGSPNLVKLCSPHNRNTHLLPTGIKIDNYTKKIGVLNDKNGICLGWIGNGKHYENDLVSILFEPLQRLSFQFELHLKIIGSEGCETLKNEFQSIEGIQTTFIDHLNWADASEVDKSIDDFDIGLYPLIENKINSYKCGFKALEYYAKGIPVVSSDVTMNREIVLDGKTGFLARTSEEWYVYLKRLIENPGLRQEMGNKGYEHVKEHYEISKIAKRFTEIIENN
jgi:glycosyltransferase involved in cell wall biosynthesis